MSWPSLLCWPQIAFVMSLLPLAAGAALGAETSPGIEWQIDSPSFEANVRAFHSVVIRLRNSSGAAQTVRLRIVADAPLRSVTASEISVAVKPGEERTVLHTLYVPPETPGGDALAVRVQAENGIMRETHIRIKALANFKATAVGADNLFVHPGEKVIYQMKIANTGNVPLHCAIQPTTSPEGGHTKVSPASLTIAAGSNAEASVEVETGTEIRNFTSFVTVAEITAAEVSKDADRQFLYFHTDAFPQPAPPDRIHLYETLKGTFSIGTGVGSSQPRARGSTDGLAREQLTLDGMITDNTRLEFIEAFTHPSERNGGESIALSSLPSSSHRNFFHLGLYNPRFDLESGEITTTSSRLLSSRETGDGLRIAVRPTASDNLQLEAFAEQNTLTLTRKEVFGASASGTLRNSPLEFWRAGTLSKRDDVGPQGKDWDTIGFDTGWKIPGSIPLRAEVSLGAGENSDGQSGLAWLAGLHYNRILPGEIDGSPVKAGIEFASGGKGFPGAQNGRDDQRAYVSYRISTAPNYVEAYANYNDSEYEVVPKIEKTLADLQDLTPEFLLTSQTRLIDAGLRWTTLAGAPGVWHVPSGNVEFQETSSFNKSDFFDRTNERAVALNLQPFGGRPAGPGGTQWGLNLLVRGGVETHENGGAQGNDSRFVTLGTDFHYSRPAPSFLEKIGGPGTVNFEFSGRFTENLDGDGQALNRTGLSTTTNATWQLETWSARVGTTVYSYEGQGVSDRIWATINRKIGHDWSMGIEAAYTHRGDAGGVSGGRNETAVLLTFSHAFEIPIPWLPRRAQAAGHVFNDINNNGRRDPGEPGLEGVKVAVGDQQALTGTDGQFSLPPTSTGTYPVRVTPPVDIHFNPSTGHSTGEAILSKGEVTELTIGLTKPATCEGTVKFVREHSEAEMPTAARSEDLSGLEILATDAAGRPQRSFARADGFFAIYLDPGTYEIQINPSSLKPQQTVSPAKLTLKVERARIENLAFTVTERPKRIRKTFVAKNP
jgi:hypothetical protein